jgi:hypothetical protein
MRDYTKLGVWQKAHEMVLTTYRATSAFPGHEAYGLTSQMRRAAASIPTNIGEGCGRDEDAELARFLRIALGSPANWSISASSDATSAISTTKNMRLRQRPSWK